MESTQLLDQLRAFKKLSLADLDTVKLQNRRDTKFAFHISKLPSFLELIKDSYGVLSINDQCLMDYQSLYYDTPNFDLYLKHHNKRRNRFKIRYRKYLVSDLTFFEIKLKNNKGRTVKRRIKVRDIEEAITGDAKDHFTEESKVTASLNEPIENLQPSLWVNFSRLTFADHLFKERATLDIGLHYVQDGKTIRCDDLVIAELKQEAFSRESLFMRALHELHIAPLRVSKYCYGMQKMYPRLKFNNFKRKFLMINKLSA